MPRFQMLLERCPYERKGTTLLVRFTVMNREVCGVLLSFTVVAVACASKCDLFQLLTVAFYQVNKLLLGMHAQFVIHVLDVRLRRSRGNAKTVADGFCIAAL